MFLDFSWSSSLVRVSSAHELLNGNSKEGSPSGSSPFVTTVVYKSFSGDEGRIVLHQFPFPLCEHVVVLLVALAGAELLVVVF